MRLKLSVRVFVPTVVAALLTVSSIALAEDKAPGKLLFEDLYFPALIDSGKKVAYFKVIEKDKTSYSRLYLGDLTTGKEEMLFPDIDFNRDKIQTFAFTHDGKYIALVDKNLTLCDVWLYDRNDLHAEPIRLTNLEQFDPGIPTDQLYQLGMNAKGVMEIKSLDFSSDDKKLIMTLGILGKTAIWMYEIDRDHYRQMTPDRKGYLPVWFPDSKRFVFTLADSASGKFSEDLLIMEARTNETSKLVTSTNNESFAVPSADGKYVAYLELSNNIWNCCVVRVSDGKIGRITDLPAGKTCNRVIWNGDGSKLYVVIGGYAGKYPALYEIPFDAKMFD